MKRLIKKAFGMTLYHGTSYNSLLNIIENGSIMPNEEKGGWHSKVTSPDDLAPEGILDNTIDNNFHGFVFLATNIEKAIGYTLNHIDNDNPGIVFEIDLSPDVLLPNDTDCPTCKTWRESSSQLGQVKVIGQIDNSYIRKVHFVKYDGTVELTANLNNCVEEYEANKERFIIDDSVSDNNMNDVNFDDEELNNIFNEFDNKPK